MRKGYFVIGPTSTTTRFTSQLIVEQGINGGWGHSQEFQEMLHPMFDSSAFTEYCLDKESQLIRCSYPHGVEDVHVESIVNALLNAEFDKVFVIVTSRAMPTSIMTNINAGHIEDKSLTKYEASRWSYDKIIHATANIWKELHPFLDNERVKIVSHNLGNFLANPFIIYQWLMYELELNPHMYTVNELLEKLRLNVETERLIEFTTTIENNYEMS